MEWSKNNRACKTTWTTLRILDQNSKTFNDSGTVTMKELTFWNQLSSPDMRKTQAKSLAIQMDNIFRFIRGAKYEDGITNEKAINHTIMTLLSEEKTIADLAEVNDNNYRFWKEEEDVF